MHSRLAYVRGWPVPPAHTALGPTVRVPACRCAEQHRLAAAPLLNLLPSSKCKPLAARRPACTRAEAAAEPQAVAMAVVAAVSAQNGLTPSQAQQAFLTMMAQPVVPDPEGAASVQLRFYRADLELDPGSDLGYRPNDSALTATRCLPSPPV